MRHTHYIVFSTCTVFKVRVIDIVTWDLLWTCTGHLTQHTAMYTVHTMYRMTSYWHPPHLVLSHQHQPSVVPVPLEGGLPCWPGGGESSGPARHIRSLTTTHPAYITSLTSLLLIPLTVAAYHAWYVTACIHLGLGYIPTTYECSTNRQCCLALHDCATVYLRYSMYMCTYSSTQSTHNRTSPTDSQHYWMRVLTHVPNQPHCYMYTCHACHVDDTGL